MSNRDPFEKLRNVDPGLIAPDIEVIRERARRLQNLKRGAVGVLTAMTVLALAFAVQPFRTGPQRTGNTSASQLRDVVESSQPSTPSPSTAASSSTEKSPVGLSAGSATKSRNAAPAAAPRRGLEVELETSSESVNAAMPLGMKVKVCNLGTSDIEVSFSTSQRYDFEVTSATTGSVVWRWSDGMVFAQVTGKERFAPGCRQVGETTWDGTDREGKPLQPGRYEARGISTSAPALSSPKRDVCVISCA